MYVCEREIKIYMGEGGKGKSRIVKTDAYPCSKRKKNCFCDKNFIHPEIFLQKTLKTKKREFFF